MTISSPPHVALVDLYTLEQALNCVQIARHLTSAMGGVLAADMGADSPRMAIKAYSLRMQNCEARLEKAIKEASGVGDKIMSQDTKRFLAKRIPT